MPMAEDFTAFFDADEFATEGLLDGQPVVGLFDHGYVEVDGMSSRMARYVMAAAAAPGVAQGSVLVLGGQTYRVRVPQPDGTGVLVLPLEVQP